MVLNSQEQSFDIEKSGQETLRYNSLPPEFEDLQKEYGLDWCENTNVNALKLQFCYVAVGISRLSSWLLLDWKLKFCCARAWEF